VLAVDLGVAVDVGGADQQLVVVAPFGARAEPAQHLEHRLDVADPRHVAHDDLLGGEHRGGQYRQRAVLVAGGCDDATKRHAAVDDELLHDVRGRRFRERDRRLG
jgi:hypothetical protein